MEATRLIRRVTTLSVAGNVFLAVLKLLAGLFGGSAALVTDAIHSVSDVAASLIAFIGVRLSRKAPDREHPYGHDRYECVASLALSLLLCATGLGAGYKAVTLILGDASAAGQTPKAAALIAAGTAILVKEGLFRFTRRTAEILNATALRADAWHHRADALASVGSLVGIGGAMLGVRVLDPVMSVGIAVLILRVALGIGRDALAQLTDTACDDETEDALREKILAAEGVAAVSRLLTRRFGGRVCVEAAIVTDAASTGQEPAKTAQRVRAMLLRDFSTIAHAAVYAVLPDDGAE